MKFGLLIVEYGQELADERSAPRPVSPKATSGKLNGAG